METALVKAWMTTPVITIGVRDSISLAHQVMKEHGIRRLPVIDNGELVGIITIGDVREASPSDATTLSIWEMNYLWAQLIVEKVMTHKPIVVHSDDSIIDAAEIMLHQKVSGLPVLDQQGQLVGMLTESDIFRMLVQSRNTIQSKTGHRLSE